MVTRQGLATEKQAYTGLTSDKTPGPILKSVEGYVIIVTGLHEELQEEDLQDTFSEHGEIKNCVLNVDRRTGYVKGYALLEYASIEEAKRTITSFNGTEIAGKSIKVDWAFKKPPQRGGGR